MSNDLQQIRDRLSVDALAWFNGAAQDVIDEMTVLASRDGIDVAVAEVEELAKPEAE